MSSSSSPSLFVRDGRRRYQPANADQILEAARQVVDLRMPRGAAFTSPQGVKQFLCAKLAGYEREVFAALYLDTRHRLLDYTELFHGTIDGAEVHPRVVVREALMRNAAAVIAAHNHPSGNPKPSAADQAVTTHLRQALALMDIRLLDHIVVAGTDAVSLAECGWV